MAQNRTPEHTMTDELRPDDDSTAPRHGRYLARWGDETPLYEAVTDAVSTVSGDARSAVASRYDQAHAFALSQLFGGDSEQSFGGDDEPTTSSTGVVKFVLSECVVSVHSHGELSVELVDRARSETN